ncbi:MAG: serine acetyltransferase [Desulfuromonas sp.]|nr:MAG: serine acetyltransferase [Desulfuromonas sp.]
MTEQIFIYGASGHAKVVIDIIERQGLYRVAFLVDDDPALWGLDFFGYPVIGGRTELMNHVAPPRKAVVAIGANATRLRVADWLCEQGFELVSAVHPSAQVSRGVSIGTGTVVMANAVVNAETRIGDNVIINTGATVDHDCVLDDGVHVSPGANLAGEVSIGSGSWIGIGAVVRQQISIGRETTVAAGAAVVRDVADGVTVAGVPAAPLGLET